MVNTTMTLSGLLIKMYGDSRIQRRFFNVSYMYGLSKWPDASDEDLALMFKGMKAGNQ